MSRCRLRTVREDDKVLVLTQHTDRIHPQALSDNLTAQVGKSRFKICLRSNIYIIYVDIRERNNDEVSRAAESVGDADQINQNLDPGSEDEATKRGSSVELGTHHQRILDMQSAKRILSEVQLSHY